MGVTCATKGVMRAPTLAIPLLVPRPKALVAVGYTCTVSENIEEALSSVAFHTIQAKLLSVFLYFTSGVYT